MSNQIDIQAQARQMKGTTESRRLRLAGKIPAVLYGAGKENEHVTLNHDAMFHNLEKEGFTASILTLNTENDSQRVILRDVQMHPYKALVMHIDFLRIRETEAMTIKVPVHLVGEDDAPGLDEGGILTQSINEIDITCLPKDLPEYLEINISELGLNESLHMSDLIMPDDVVLTGLMYVDEDDEHAMADANHAVVSIVTPRAPTEDIEETDELDEDLEPGEEGEDSKADADSDEGDSSEQS